ncbi:MAG: hypothetical protein K6E30_08865 [Lachnospiraceae bacterium]|nr:hypothetical protein [Lachnospiraceae bacterium]
MFVSDAIRKAMKKAKLSQTRLGEIWDTTPQVINNKMRLQRWTAEELAQVAGYTGGKLMFVFPDGEQIEIEPQADPESQA